jgi:hypothetical protein
VQLDHVSKSRRRNPAPYLPGPRAGALQSRTRAYVNTISTVGQQPDIRATAIERRNEALHPLERHGDGGAGEPHLVRVRRPSVQLRLGRHAVRSGLQPFLAGASDKHPGDMVFFQGHASPGIYARAYLSKDA